MAALIAITAVGWKLGLNSVLSFWIIYILTRPLGASIGDYLSQPATRRVGSGTTVTSMIFVGGIIGIVVYLSVTKADVISAAATRSLDDTEGGPGWSGARPRVVLVVLLVAGVAGYFWRTSSLEADTVSAAATAPSRT